MIHNQKKTILKIFLVLFIILLANSYVFPRMYANSSDDAYEEGVKKGRSLETDIVEGAGYFLMSYSDILLFLNKIEISDLEGTNYSQLRTIIDRAVVNMDQAKLVYISLIQMAETTPYNQQVINQLITFDYTGFQQEKALNGTVFKEAEQFLKKGDVRGLYAQLLLETEMILSRMATIKSALDVDKFPQLSDLWRLNQKTCETLLLGQYTAEVFYRIAGE